MGDDATLPSSHPPPGEPSARRFGRYFLLERLGQGGMGEVFSAYDPGLDRKLALKLVRAAPDALGDAQQRILREAKALARLAHPNVVAVHDVGAEGEQLFIAMEFVAGDNLSEWLGKAPRTWAEVLAVFTQAGAGLAAAHHAGLLHRDFKPANVLVGADGRVRVADFGLAVAEGARAAPRAPGAALAASVLSPLTAPGQIQGTPAYMSPEQAYGDPLDARTDQFSFCVALYEALYRQVPFPGEKLDERVAAIPKGPLPPPAGSEVPGWLFAALRRGLAAAPADRFASLDALLAALTRKRRRRGAQLGAAVAVIAAVGLAASSWLATPRPCAQAGAELASVWGAVRAAEVEAALFTLPGDGAKTVRARLERYAADWNAMNVEACQATRVRGVQTEGLLERRVACLDGRRRSFATLVEVVRSGATAPEHVWGALSGLPEVADCADLENLQRQLPLPSGKQWRAAIEALRRNVADSKVLTDLGRFDEGLEGARLAVQLGDQVPYPPLQAEAWHVLGYALAQRREFGPADEALRTAVARAVAGGADEVLVEAATALVLLDGLRMGKVAEAAIFERLALAGTERLGHRPDLEGKLALARASLAYENGDPTGALAHVDAALPLLIRAFSARSFPVARAHTNRALVLSELARHDDAAAAYETGLALFDELVGPTHPDRLGTEADLWAVRVKQGRLEEAYQGLVAMVRVLGQVSGEENQRLAAGLSSVCEVATQLGRHPEALAACQRSLAIDRKASGEKSRPAAVALFNLGEAQLEAGDWAAARKSYQEAVEIAAGKGPFSALFAAGVARTELAEGKPARALPALEAAYASREKLPPSYRPQVTFALAQALRDSGREPARVRALAEEALRVRDETRSAAVSRARITALLERLPKGE